MKKYTLAEIILIAVVVLALVFGCLCLEAWLGMLLFNWVISLFGGAFAFTFWQAFGIVLALSFIGSFFKGSSSNKS